MHVQYRRIRKPRHCKAILVILVIFSVITYLRSVLINTNCCGEETSKIIANNNYYESYLAAYEGTIIKGLGHNGEPAKLKEKERKEGMIAVKRVGMNTVLSDRMPLNRTLRDPRNPLCKNFTYNVSLKASVIVIFYNEILSVILRTIWSVILQTPNHLLEEIILVDDASTEINLNGLLQYYIDTRLKDYNNIKLITLKSRQGLIRARLEGARPATGDVLVFLDAHCEATVGWIEPLLQRIEEDNTAVVTPIIDILEADTLAYTTFDYSFSVGGFTWSGDFTWIGVQTEEENNQLTPLRSPTMAGGLFAINRRFFWDIGSYDEQMDGWGGENLEMSFRIWQCGGRVETVPCSRVGHIFRDIFPYTLPGGKNTFDSNTVRLVEVWMDDYKRLFYMHRPDLRNNLFVGDLTERMQLRQRLGCKSFRWYLENVYPEKFIPDENVYVFGQFKNRRRCLDNLYLAKGQTGDLGIVRCRGKLDISQFFSLTLAGQLRIEDVCAVVVNERNVKLETCRKYESSQLWRVYKNGTIYHPESKKCLTAERTEYGQGATVAECDDSPLQKWSFTNVNKTALVM